MEKIFFVTSADIPFFPGRGGTEAFTFSHIRELRSRGYDASILTVGLTKTDGRALVPDIPFVDMNNEQGLRSIDATLVGVCKPFTVATKRPSFMMVHVPPSSTAYSLSDFRKSTAHHSLIANSGYTKARWAESLGIPTNVISVVYPFADPAFAEAKRTKSDKIRVLFAGRLHINKGIFLLLEALHHQNLRDGYRFSVIDIRGPDRDSQIISDIVHAHPFIDVLPAADSPQKVAHYMAQHDIVVVPSNHHFWQEAFGMVAIEAQHAGCRAVVADSGGLPEANAGALYLFEPGNSLALADAIDRARTDGPMSPTLRKQAAKQFTLAQSVDSLLQTIGLG